MQKKTVTEGGSTYELTAEPGDGGYYGRWTCLNCGESSGSNHCSKTPDQAMMGLNFSPHTRLCPHPKPQPLKDIRLSITTRGFEIQAIRSNHDGSVYVQAVHTATSRNIVVTARDESTAWHELKNQVDTYLDEIN